MKADPELRSPRPLLARLVAATLTVATLTASTSTFASPPDPRECTIDAVGVGDATGLAVGGSRAGFHATIRDINGAPIATGWAGLAFAGSGIRIYSAQDAGVTVDVAQQQVTARFVSGTANFNLRTGGFNNSGAVEAIGSGVVLGLVKWRSTDIDGLDGRTGLGDVSYFAARYLALAPAPECNFDRSPTDVPDAADLALLAHDFLSGASGTYAW